MTEYKEIKKEYQNLGKLIGALDDLRSNDLDKFQELIAGIEYDSWEEFEVAIKELNKFLKDKEISSKANPLLYRGQCSEGWSLETTLERYTDKEYTIKEYLQLIQSAKWAYESHFDKSCGTDDINFAEIRFELADPHPFYQLLSYFRHLGFPSPLLDWTHSFYVAAYFAFRESSLKDGSRSVAIYTFLESSKYGKGIFPSEGYVGRLGRNIPTHKRHYLQQAEYTYALSLTEDAIGDEFEIDCSKVSYANHYNTLMSSMESSGTQDICFKHIIPISEKDKVINCLNSMNINEYGLFHTEESLVKTIAYERVDTNCPLPYTPPQAIPHQ